MVKRIFFGWSNDTIIITVIYSIVIIAVLLYIFKTISFKDSFNMWGGKLITAVIIIAAEIYFATITPPFLSYSEDEIRIAMYATKKQDLVLVDAKTKKYVFNCSERDDLIAFVQTRL